MTARRRRKRFFESHMPCGGCGRLLEVAGYRTLMRPSTDVPDEAISYQPAPGHLMLHCTCGHHTIFAPTDAIEVMKARRARPGKPSG